MASSSLAPREFKPTRNPLQCTWRLRRSIPVAGHMASCQWHSWSNTGNDGWIYGIYGWIYGKWMEMMVGCMETVSRNHKHTHFDHVNPFFGLILVIPTWCLVARAPCNIGTPDWHLENACHGITSECIDATRFGLWGAVWDVSQIQDAPLPHRAGVVAMWDQCGTNVGRDVLPHIWISAFGPWLVLDYRQMQMPLTRLPNCMMLGKGGLTDD